MFYREDEGGLLLFIRLTPKSAKDTIIGVEHSADGKTHLNIRVRAVPEDGKANKALIKFLAKHLKIPASSMNIASGNTSRHKQLYMQGDGGALLAKLQDAIPVH